jgi:hypothetical protein
LDKPEVAFMEGFEALATLASTFTGVKSEYLRQGWSEHMAEMMTLQTFKYMTAQLKQNGVNAPTESE